MYYSNSSAEREARNIDPVAFADAIKKLVEEFNWNGPANDDDGCQWEAQESKAEAENTPGSNKAAGEAIADVVDHDAGDWKSLPIKIATYSDKFCTAGKIVESTHRQFMDFLLVHEEGLKDGRGYLQGSIVENGKSKKAVFVCDMAGMGFDFDELKGPEELEALLANIRKLNVAAVVYTTHSHTYMKPRIRVWLPFSVVVPLKGAREEDSALWKRVYTFMANTLAAKHDESCHKMERFFYSGRHAKDGTHWSEEISGAPLSWEKLKALAAKANPDNRRHEHARERVRETCDVDDEGDGVAGEAEPEHFAAFWPEFRKHFNIADALRHCDDLNPSEREDGKVESACVFPLEDHVHDDGSQNPNPTKRPLVAYNADVARYKTATSHCARNSCPGMKGKIGSRGFAAKILAMFSHPIEWREFVEPEHQKRFDLWWELQPVSLDDIGERIKNLDTSKEGAVLGIQAELAKHDINLPEVQELIDQLSAASKTARGRIEKGVKAKAKEYNKKKDEYARKHRPKPERGAVDLGETTIIRGRWSHPAQCRTTISALEERNARSLRLFVRPEGGVVRVAKTDTTINLDEVDTVPKWEHELTEAGLEFLSYNPATEREKSGPPFESVVKYVRGSKEFQFPVLERVTDVPLFSPSGVLCTTPGYHEDAQMWFEPNVGVTYFPVPDVPSPADVARARAELLDVLRDFPFSDWFGGADPLPVRLMDENGDYTDLDEDGFPRPNLDRGKSSRAHAVALILQPFVRSMIAGPTPAYHIDKPAPGTGAGFFVDVTQLILTGRPANIQTVATDEAAFKKEVTATLRSGVPTMFLDNISTKVTYGSLAALLTAGRWQDRILGVSENATIDVKTTFILAGNVSSFSEELLDRNIPIRLDASLPKPVEGRPLLTFFKYSNLSARVLERRPQLVWACHVLVRNWVARGKPRGAQAYERYPEWSQVMGGILEAAGIDGFLDNRKSYRTQRSDEGDIARTVAQDVFDAIGLDAPCSLGDIYEKCCDGGFAAFSGTPRQPKLKYDGIPIDTRSEFQQRRDFFKWWRENVAPKPFDLQRKISRTAGAIYEPVRVTLVKGASNGAETYKFAVVK